MVQHGKRIQVLQDVGYEALKDSRVLVGGGEMEGWGVGGCSGDEMWLKPQDCLPGD